MMIGNEPEYEIDIWADGKKSAEDRVKQMTLNSRPGKTQAYIYKPLIQVIDLFCGGGGFTQGVINAGCQVVLAVDCWQPALDIHEANNPQVPVAKIELGGSIVETAIVLRRSLTSGSHFHLHGSPPCQNISNASNGNPEEGMVLVRWFLDLVEYMQPDSWSMENVLPVAKRLPEGTPYVKLNSADFGVPQTRNRIFAGEGWVAEPTHSKEDWVSVLDALPYLEGELTAAPSMVDRWSNIGNDRPFPTVTSQSPKQIRVVSRRRKAGEEPQSYTPDRPAHTITQVQHIIEHKTVVNTDGCSKTIHNTRPTLRIVLPIQRKVGVLKSNGRILQPLWRELAEPVNTITSLTPTIGSLPIETTRESPIKAIKIRSLTLQETAILQGFSSSMKIPYGRKKDAWTVIGNAVCPPVAEAVIRGIIQ